MPSDTDTSPKPASAKRKPRAPKKTEPRQAKIEEAKPIETKKINDDFLDDVIPHSPFYDRSKRETMTQLVADAKYIVETLAVNGIVPAMARRIERLQSRAHVARTHLVRETEKLDAGAVKKPNAISTVENKLLYHRNYIVDLENKLKAAREREQTLVDELALAEKNLAGQMEFRRRETSRGAKSADIAARHAFNDIVELCEDIVKRRDEWETGEMHAGRNFEHWKTRRPYKEKRPSEHSSEA